MMKETFFLFKIRNIKMFTKLERRVDELSKNLYKNRKKKKRKIHKKESIAE